MLTFVIPFLNERESLPLLFGRLLPVAGQLPMAVEYVLVDDGSTDGGSMVVEEYAANHQNVKLAVLSRNFGHQAALSAGLGFASGDYVCVLDADLQDPPELVAEMLACAQDGADVVYAQRSERDAPLGMRICYWLYYRLLRMLADTNIPLDAGDFCLMNRRALDALLSLPEQQRFLRGLRSWIGFKQVALKYVRPQRAAGVPKYNLRRLFRLAFDGIFSFSTKPLRLATWLGLCLALFCLCYTGYAIGWRLFSGQNLPGFATIAVGIFFVGAVQLISIGILGEYIGRVYQEVKRRPAFIVTRTINLASGCANSTSCDPGPQGVTRD